jgi:hypothetical protein
MPVDTPMPDPLKLNRNGADVYAFAEVKAHSSFVSFPWDLNNSFLPMHFHRYFNHSALSPADARQIIRSAESMAKTPAPTPSGFAEIVSDDFPVYRRGLEFRRPIFEFV